MVPLGSLATFTQETAPFRVPRYNLYPSAEIQGAKALTRRPFGVNVITMHPQLNELIDICSKHEVTHVVLAGGLLLLTGVLFLARGWWTLRKAP